MSRLYNLARMTTATTGTGTIALGSAVSGYLTFAAAGVQDGDFVTYGIKDGSSSELGYGKYAASGTTLTRNPITSTNANAAINLSGAAEVYVTAGRADFPFPDNWLTGLTLSNDGTSPNTVIDITAGVAADTANVELMRLTSAITKSTSAWAVGSGNGGLDAGAIAASTWYHVWLIRRPDSGVVDVLLSTSASSPTMPTSYTQKRRIGAIRTDGSSHILAFSQNGDEFLWSAPVGDVNGFNLLNTSTLFTLTVPTGVKVIASMRLAFNNSAGTVEVLVQSPDEGTQVANTPAGNATVIGSNTLFGWGVTSARTNTSGQVRAVSNASGGTSAFYLATAGWLDRRGRDG